METTITYVSEADQELERRRRTGATGPDIMPHTDDIRINEETGLPYFAGPMTHADKWRYVETCETIKFFENEDDPDEREELKERIQIFHNGIQMLDERIGGWRPKD